MAGILEVEQENNKKDTSRIDIFWKNGINDSFKFIETHFYYTKWTRENKIQIAADFVNNKNCSLKEVIIGKAELFFSLDRIQVFAGRVGYILHNQLEFTDIRLKQCDSETMQIGVEAR